MAIIKTLLKTGEYIDLQLIEESVEQAYSILSDRTGDRDFVCFHDAEGQDIVLRKFWITKVLPTNEEG